MGKGLVKQPINIRDQKMKDRKNIITAWVVAILAGLLLFIPFLGGVHLFDWDEINFAESAREMIATGDYLTVKNKLPAILGETTVVHLDAGAVYENLRN